VCWANTFKETPIAEPAGLWWKMILLNSGDDFIGNL
jgi:hypothetical protein